MAAVLYLGAVLIWFGGFIGGFICISNRYIDNSFLIALIIWLGAFFEGALIFAVARIYQATVDSHEKENPETESYEERTYLHRLRLTLAQDTTETPQRHSAKHIKHIIIIKTTKMLTFFTQESSRITQKAKKHAMQSSR